MTGGYGVRLFAVAANFGKLPGYVSYVMPARACLRSFFRRELRWNGNKTHCLVL